MAEAAPPVAHLNARISAYLVDSVILLAFVLLFFVIAGAQLLLTSDLGEDDPPDSAYYAFVAIFSGGLVLAWTAFNLALMAWRGQTAGKYVLGIKTVGDGRSKLSLGQLLLRWLGLHPLLLHPLLVLPWGVFSFLAVSFTLNRIVFVITGALVLLCVVAPVVALVAVLLDPQRRALHDRLAHTLVVHLDQP